MIMKIGIGARQGKPYGHMDNISVYLLSYSIEEVHDEEKDLRRLFHRRLGHCFIFIS